jgi:hypothetical protein
MELHENTYQQAFEDFLRNDAERGITEATSHLNDGHALWVLLFEDGRYALEHDFMGNFREKNAACVAVPIEPLNDREFDAANPEDSTFDRAIDTMWQRFRASLKTTV